MFHGRCWLQCSVKLCCFLSQKLFLGFSPGQPFMKKHFFFILIFSILGNSEPWGFFWTSKCSALPQMDLTSSSSYLYYLLLHSFHSLSDVSLLENLSLPPNCCSPLPPPPLHCPLYSLLSFIFHSICLHQMFCLLCFHTVEHKLSESDFLFCLLLCC